MDERVKQLLGEARDHYQKREYDKADYLLREVVESTDRFADVFDMLGVIAHSRGDFPAAERYFERAVTLNPAYTEALLNLAVTYNDLGKYDAARRIYARVRGLGGGGEGAAQLDPFARGKIANMHADIGQAYAEATMIAEAIDEYRKAITLCPGFADLRTRLGSLYRDAGQLERAKEQYAAAKEANPKFVQARVLLGVTLLSLGDIAGALEEWRDVIAMDPLNKSAQMYIRMVEIQTRPGPSTPAKTG